MYNSNTSKNIILNNIVNIESGSKPFGIFAKNISHKIKLFFNSPKKIPFVWTALFVSIFCALFWYYIFQLIF